MASHSARHLRDDSERKRTPVALRVIRTIILDLLMMGVILCIFAVFHHVIPRWGYKLTANRSSSAAVTTVTPAPAATAAPATEPETAADPETSAETTAEPVAAPEATEDPRTEWQIKFADKFTDEIIQTDNTYTSPDVSITVTTYSGEINGYYNTWHVADIYIGSIDNFRTSVAFNGWTAFSDEDAVQLDQESGAILSVNGDFCTAQYSSGYMVRNGVTYYSDQTTCDICVLYRDGTMETYGPNDYVVGEVAAQDPWQVWRFGPELLDDNGQPLDSYNASWAILAENPRTGIGYYEPGHYCFVVVDGRIDGYSRGVTTAEFAQLFADLGCTRAYNLDGGASSAMTFNDALYNRQSSYRKLGDTLIIVEPDAIPAEAETVTEGEN